MCFFICLPGPICAAGSWGRQHWTTTRHVGWLQPLCWRQSDSSCWWGQYRVQLCVLHFAFMQIPTHRQRCPAICSCTSFQHYEFLFIYSFILCVSSWTLELEVNTRMAWSDGSFSEFVSLVCTLICHGSANSLLFCIMLAWFSTLCLRLAGKCYPLVGFFPLKVKEFITRILMRREVLRWRSEQLTRQQWDIEQPRNAAGNEYLLHAATFQLWENGFKKFLLKKSTRQLYELAEWDVNI